MTQSAPVTPETASTAPSFAPAPPHPPIIPTPTPAPTPLATTTAAPAANDAFADQLSMIQKLLADYFARGLAIRLKESGLSPEQIKHAQEGTYLSAAVDHSTKITGSGPGYEKKMDISNTNKIRCMILLIFFN